MSEPRPWVEPKAVRLNVNLNQECADALRFRSSQRGITITEGIRRSIAIWNFVEAEIAAGHTILIRNGDSLREVVLL